MLLKFNVHTANNLALVKNAHSDSLGRGWLNVNTIPNGSDAAALGTSLLSRTLQTTGLYFLVISQWHSVS